MDEFSTTSDTLDQADEDNLTYTVSDEALEAAIRGILIDWTRTYLKIAEGCRSAISVE